MTEQGKDIRVGGDPKETHMQQLARLESELESVIAEKERLDNETPDDGEEMDKTAELEKIHERLEAMKNELPDLKVKIDGRFPEGVESGGAVVIQRFEELEKKIEAELS